MQSIVHTDPAEFELLLGAPCAPHGAHCSPSLSLRWFGVQAPQKLPRFLVKLETPRLRLGVNDVSVI